jgi:hypothetical protein
MLMELVMIQQQYHDVVIAIILVCTTKTLIQDQREGGTLS